MQRIALIILFLSILLPASAGASPVDDGLALLTDRGCLSCHSLDGSAQQGPSLLGIVDRTSQAHVRRSITHPEEDIAEGYTAGIMPAYSLSDRELDSILAALSAQPAPPGDTASTGSIAAVALGAVAFIGLHLLLSSGWIRPHLVTRLGESGFAGLYSLLAIASLWWTWEAWEAAPYVALWPSPPWTRWVPNIGMPFVCILVLAGYTTPSPTIVGMESTLARGNAATGILRITRHPANVGFTLWGLLHLFPNGDVATVLLIMAFVGLGILGTWHIERRRQAAEGEAWLTYARQTSIIPFAAILGGRQRLVISEIGWARIVGGLLIWALLLMLHRHIIGVSPLPLS